MHRVKAKCIALGKTFGIRALVLGSMLLMPKHVEAATLSQLLEITAFKNLVLTIAALNRTMKDAAENPMDDYRRANVQRAVQALPPAIILLAKEFKAGRLHDGDVAFVMQLLGSAVDTSAPDRYKKFIASPNAALIPQMSNMIPQNLVRQGEASAPSSSGSGSGARIAFDDSRSRSNGPRTSSGSSDQVLDLSESKDYEASNTTRAQAERELSSIAERQSREPGRGVSEDILRERQSKTDSSQYRVEASPKYFHIAMAARVAEALLFNNAFANGGGGAPGGGQGGQQGSDCKDCQGGGAGGGGGGGGGAGGAEMLFALATVIAAAAPVAIAAQQANADKAIAKTNAQTNLQMAQMQADTNLEMAQKQTDLAQFQANKAVEASVMSNQAVTQRMNMQLASLEQASLRSEAAKQQELAQENYWNQRRADLAEQNRQDNLKFAQAAYDAEMVRLGLSQGASRVQDSGAGLQVSPTVTQTSAGTISGSAYGSSTLSRGSSLASSGASGGTTGGTSSGLTFGAAQRTVSSLSDEKTFFADDAAADDKSATSTASRSRLTSSVRSAAEETKPSTTTRSAVGSDLSSYISKTKSASQSTIPGFAEYREQSFQKAGVGGMRNFVDTSAKSATK